MNLSKQTWSQDDAKAFSEFLKTKENKEKVAWTKNLLVTSMPVLAIMTPELKTIIKELKSGNVEEFLKVCSFDFYESTIIYAHLMTTLPFETFASHLDILSRVCDNWATCDSIPFKNIKEKEQLFLLAERYAFFSLPFQRRIGMKMLFEFTKDESKIDEIFEMLGKFEKEEHYYVNMVNAWLVCELFIKQKEKTWQFLKQGKLNKFTLNKAISKCCDSFRVSEEEKELLKQLKK